MATRKPAHYPPIVLVSVVLVAAAVSACGSGSSSSGGGGATTAKAVRVVARPPGGELVRPGSLTMCTETGTPPAAFYDARKRLTGYLPAFGDAIAARMGLRANWVDSVFDTIIIAANTGKCDMVVADQFITPERLKQIRMFPYAEIGQQLLATKSGAGKWGDPSTDPTANCSAHIGVLSGAAEIDTIKQWSKQCQAAGKTSIKQTTYGNTPAGLQALQGQQVDLFFTDSPITGYYGKERADQFATVGKPVADVKAGISVPKKKAALQQALVEVLKAMKRDGSYQHVFRSWGQSAMLIDSPGQP